MNPKFYNAKELRNKISSAKNELITPEKFKKIEFDEKVVTLYKKYCQKLKLGNSVDFDDLLLLPIKLFELSPSILNSYQEKYKYILIDEYQDTNEAQYIFSKMLSQKYRNIFVVGDNDQAIYAFRGANFKNILNFEKDYPDCKTILLEENYRSTQTILNAANSVIKHNKLRKDKNLWSNNEVGNKIKYVKTDDEHAEGEYVIQEIKKLKSENVNYDDIAILYRTNAQSRSIEEAMLRANIPYRIIGSFYFYNRKEIKDLLCYLRLINNPKDDVSLTRIINVPKRGIGNVTIGNLAAKAEENNCSMFEAIKSGKELGFKNVYVVPEQEKPDGNFPTVSYPNPEDPKAFKLALELAKEKDADVVLATDPDSDRLGIFAKDTKTGEYINYTGNMSALLIAEYEISQKKEKGLLPNNGMIIKTIVSTNLTDAVAKAYGLELIEVLTGFKYIGEVMRKAEEKKDKEYVFGFEESYGCLIGTYARDKDGVGAVMALCEAAAYYKSKGLTLWDQMINIYEKYGYYKEGQISIVLEGAEGAEKIKSMMTAMREKNIDRIGDYKVLTFKDYDKNIVKDMETGKITETGLPKSNVLYYELENNSWCCVRPSGTEPKIKLYMGIKGNSMDDANAKLNDLQQAMETLVRNA